MVTGFVTLTQSPAAIATVAAKLEYKEHYLMLQVIISIYSVQNLTSITFNFFSLKILKTLKVLVPQTKLKW